MKTAVFYFSGTGNTARVVESWTEALDSYGIGSDTFRIEEKPKADFSEYNSIGIAYPIHAFNAPKIVLDFALSLPQFSETMKVYLIMVSGEPLRLNASSDQKLRKILKKKNALVESAWHYIMPYNMVFRHTETQAWQMYGTMQKLVPLDVKNYFIDGNPHLLHPIHHTGALTAAFRIEQWFSSVNGRLYHVTDNCVKCMKCIEACPVENISLRDGKLHFADRCILCTRCSFYCPKDAIRIGILDFWRVNHPYSFKKPVTPEINRHKNFCKKSYARYFEEASNRLKK